MLLGLTVKEYAMLPLILVPGLLCDAALWRPLALGANGRSVRVADLTAASSIERMARMILADAPPRFALAGLSMGGYVAMEICRQSPERVDRLALLDTNSNADSSGATERRHSQMATARQGRFDEVIDALLSLIVHPDNREDPAIAGTFRSMAHRMGVDVFCRQQEALITRRDQGDTLAGLACPALVLCGAQDALTPPKVHEAMAKLIPDSSLVIVPDCGHLAPLEQPATVRAAMQHWLDG
jgi:pimeloyl-ACP methyl ester carboxylesterase